ncbi:hypothetical protein MRX96_010644 [Rhipicephalus microplus]
MPVCLCVLSLDDPEEAVAITLIRETECVPASTEKHKREQDATSTPVACHSGDKQPIAKSVLTRSEAKLALSANAWKLISENYFVLLFSVTVMQYEG